MSKSVLNVGQCNPDNSSISAMLQQHFDVTVVTAESHQEALDLATNCEFDLILLNRIYDATGTEGMETLRELKANSQTSELPVMLVSNFQESQDAAVQAGAAMGFGKSALGDPMTIDKLRPFLA